MQMNDVACLLQTAYVLKKINNIRPASLILEHILLVTPVHFQVVQHSSRVA